MIKRAQAFRGRSLALFGILALSLVIGISLMAANVFGLSQSIRKPGLGVTDLDQLRFVPNEVWSYSQSTKAIAALSGIPSRVELVEQANTAIHLSLIHVDWERVDPSEYRLLIPFWENYFLWAVGRFTDLPQFNRYHYADYQRSLRRGVGICGDASIALSSVLDRYQVPNRIVSFDGHVIVEYDEENGERFLLDPDFGVALGTSLKGLRKNERQVRARYISAGYTEQEVAYLFEAYNREYFIFDDTFDFMTLRYVFEKTTYAVKWLLPLGLILVPMLWLYRVRRRNPLASKAR